MLEGKAALGETDMPVAMQAHAMRVASRALDVLDVCDCQGLAAFLKKEFDKCYGPGWQCVVGTNFGSFVTHASGNFIYFGIERLSFLLFRGAPV
ncbi:hypothetical protein L7F22_014656 [Adiantum nelumboides]|nr:hypothetical protein [Adiantum nelumboides]MCO5561035.1 hypothetical protein [Adiantum nelumboides]